MSLVRLKHKMRRAIRPFMILFAVIFFVSCFTLYGSYTYSRTQQTAPVARVNGAVFVKMGDNQFQLLPIPIVPPAELINPKQTQ